LSKPQARDNYAEAIGFFERALALDPHSVEAQSRLAHALAGRLMDYTPSSSDSDLNRAEELVSQALAASPRNPFAHFAKGHLRRAQGGTSRPFPNTRRPSPPTTTGWSR
jgi:adenylate cyclase